MGTSQGQGFLNQVPGLDEFQPKGAIAGHERR